MGDRWGAAFVRIGWQASFGLGGSFAPDWVAGITGIRTLYIFQQFAYEFVSSDSLANGGSLIVPLATGTCPLRKNCFTPIEIRSQVSPRCGGMIRWRGFSTYTAFVHSERHMSCLIQSMSPSSRKEKQR